MAKSCDTPDFVQKFLSHQSRHTGRTVDAEKVCWEINAGVCCPKVYLFTNISINFFPIHFNWITFSKTEGKPFLSQTNGIWWTNATSSVIDDTISKRVSSFTAIENNLRIILRLKVIKTYFLYRCQRWEWGHAWRPHMPVAYYWSLGWPQPLRRQ